MASPPVYLSPPGVLCCAGSNRALFYEAALKGCQEGIVPGTFSGGRRFLTGRIADGLLPGGPSSAGESGKGTGGITGKEPGGGAEDSRLLRIADAALEQIRGDVEQVLAAYGPRRIAVCVGSCDNGSEWSLAAHRSYFIRGAFPRGYDLSRQGAGYPAAYCSRKLGLSGPSLAVSTACSSGAGALIKAAELIRAGLCDAAVAGGLDIASETALLGFASLELVSEEVCNPFSKNRRGITLGEGAAFFVLSSRDFSGAGIELAGIGESADASHITSPRADGGGAIRAMEEALKNAGMGPGDLGYINLHGTGTPLNDRMEARALAAVFPAPEKAPLVSSTKPITGHTLGAAGALELALCWMALHGSAAPAVTEGPAGRTGAAALPAALPAARTAALPVHCWDGVYDDDLPVLRFAAPGDGAVNLRACMSNSFAFGGCNISLILRKRDDHGL